MYPPAPPPIADEDLNGFDEQATVYLERLCHKSPLPENVIELNLYQYKPCNLPGGIWFLVCSAEEKKAESGFWRQKEAASEIFSNSDVSVWRTTLEFVEIQDAREQRTDWLMLEYKLAEKGPRAADIEKESRAICRVFLSGGRTSNLEDQNSYARGTAASVVQGSDKGFANSVLVNSGGDAKQLSSEAEAVREMLNGEYLELDDLADPLSLSTTSNNSSRSSLSLDEYFDPYALMQELEGATDQSQQASDSNSGSSLVIQPAATSGSLVCGAECTLPSSMLETQNTDKRVADQAMEKLNPEEKKGDSSRSVGDATSSNIGKMKSLKKYFCLMTF